MDEKTHKPNTMQNRTVVERKSDRELVVTRTFDAPAHTVFEAWAKPELFRQWWPPKSMGMPLRSCEMDVRTGGKYRLEFGHDATNTMAFFGTYIDVIAPSRLVWTNEESADGAITTVSFEEKTGVTLLIFRELYASKQALDDSFPGMEGGMPEQFEQLDALLISSM